MAATSMVRNKFGEAKLQGFRHQAARPVVRHTAWQGDKRSPGFLLRNMPVAAHATNSTTQLSRSVLAI